MSICLLAVMVTAVCGPTAPAPTSTPTEVAITAASQIITLGDIDPDEPTKKVKRFRPLADYLADNLKEFGITEGSVLIAGDIEQMASYFKNAKVDVYFDSAFPTLAVQDLAGSDIILRRWKGGVVEYWGTYVALRSSGIIKVEDLVGKVIAFEEPRSTSGFVLPAGTLVQRGFNLKEVDAPDANVGSDEIGYVFSRDEENTFEMVMQATVAGGAVSSDDYEELSAGMKDRIIAFDWTITVPRQLVSVRPALDRRIVDKIRELLITLDQTEQGRQILEGLKNTKKFDVLPADAEAALEGTRRLMELVAK